MRSLCILLLLAPLLCFGADNPLEIKDGDRVLFLGDVLLEREGTYAALETRLDEQFSDRHFTVRNLSWSGDTPKGVARASFDGPGKGWDRLKEQIATAKPTVAFLGFGMASSLQEIADRSGDILLNPDVTRYGRDPMTAARFRKELEELMDTVKAAGGADVRFVLLSPIAHEDLRGSRPGLPDPSAHQALLNAYSTEIEHLATERGARYVSLQTLAAPQGAPALTTNGIHLTENGYEAFGDAVVRGLGWTAKPVDPARRAALRESIQRKSQLFFYEWRPENYTYLFGFRNHEQGQNAKEIPQFEPLIAEEEKQIDARKAELGQPGGIIPPKPAPAPLAPPVAANLPKFDIQEGYQIELWASNPLLEKPIQMNWDSDGRLWVASSSTYPQVNPEDVASTMALAAAKKDDAPSAANDRIIILEDSQHAGHADKSTVFADGLLIPTGVAPFRNAQGQWGCYVTQSTEILELTDTDGQGHSTQRRPVLSGFGTEDTHHLVHTLKWAPDARLNFNQSIYIHTHLETPWGMVRLNSGAVAAWDPRTEKVEMQCKGECNPWGHVWDAHGESFLTDGAGGEGITWAIPGAMFFTYENGRRICPSISPGSYPKFASLERIQSPNFPEDWQGSMITCDFRAHRIVHFGVNDLSPAASGYITKELPDLVRTDDVSFRPIDVRMGPDGALYVADWSNPVINHGEVDFRDPRRDHHQGRIWRITRKGGPVVPWEKLTEKPKAELATYDTTKPAWQEQQARVVVAYGPGAGPDNRKAPVPFAALAEAARDEIPRIRLKAMRSLAERQTPEAAEAVLEAALKAPPNDEFYNYTAWLSINDLAEPWSKAVLSGAWKIDSPAREKELEFALNSLDPQISGPVLAKAVETHPVSADSSASWIDLIRRAGGPRELAQLFHALIEKKVGPEASVHILQALRSAVRLRNVRPEGDLAPIETLLHDPNAQLAGDAARLTGTWKTPQALAALGELAEKGQAEVPPAAIEGLREVGGSGAIAVLQNLMAARPVTPVAQEAAAAFAALDFHAALPAVAGLLKDEPSEDNRLKTWRALLANKGAAEQVVKALDGGLPIDPSIAGAGLRASRELGIPGKALTDALEKISGMKPAPTASQDYSALVKATQQSGNPAHGEEIFRRANLACLICHAIGGAGGKVGPELTSLGASAPLDYIIESVLQPQAKVKEGFNAVNVTLKDGSAMAGIPVRETATEIFLRIATGQEMPVPKASVVTRENIGSIMPAGLTDQLTPAERLDLYAFLGQLGKPGAFDASKGTVARYWGLFPGTTADRTLPWPTAGAGFTTVDGRLTKEQAQSALAVVPEAGNKVLAATRFQLPTAGPANLHLTGATEAILDGQPIKFSQGGNTRAELPAGEHTLVVALDRQALPEVLRLELPEARFLGN